MIIRPCIVVPGIQGSTLQNFYPIDPVTTWSTMVIAESKFVAPDFNSLALADDGRADRASHVVSRSSALIEVAYAPLVSGLQGRSGMPAYLFAYDWRYSIVASARALMRYVESLQAKSIPEAPGWAGDFDFACHSMGGLVFRAFLAEWRRTNPAKPLPVGRVAFIATPHKGSLDAPAALITGESPLFGGQKAMRKLARTYPSVYELLPLPGSGVMWAERGGIEVDLFQESNWQRNTTTAVAAPGGFDVEQRHLDEARHVLTTLPMPTDPTFGLVLQNLLVIYGAKENSTLESVAVGQSPDNWYDFDNARRGVGDDVVLVGSAKLPGVTAVQIRPEDLSYIFHPVQRAYAEADLHAFLPALDEVQTIVSAFFGGATGTTLLPLNLQRATPSRIS
jgi:Lecithin:cholesterol acyltransferase